MSPFVTVICPIFNEEKYITTCVESVLQQDYPRAQMEVFFVDGMSGDRTRALLQPYMEAHDFIHLLDNPRKTVPYAMNLAIERARGEVIVRLDAHAAFPKNYISLLVNELQAHNADNVGALCKTEVQHKTKTSLAICAVLQHRFGVGNALFRVGSDQTLEVDTVPFGCFKKSVFDRFGNYNELLTRNQDIELNKRIKRGGGKILLVPTISCTYFARETYCGIAKNNFQNGLWNLLTVKITKQFSSLSLRHFVPLFFLFSLLLPLFAAIFYLPLAWLSVVSLGCYLLFLATICWGIARRKKLSFFALAWGFITLHISYGIGSLVGIFKKVKRHE